MYALINGQIYTGYHVLKNHAIIISDDYIKDICPISYLTKDIKQYDMSGLIISPGFLDLQLNGCGGVQFNDNLQSISIQTLKIMQITNRFFGCTSFLPTLISSSDSLIKKAVEIVRLFLNKNKNQILGLHLEGPFINVEKKGIHDASIIRLPSKKMINYLCNNNDVIKKITLAPEQLINMSTIEKLKQSGIYISIGHSNATYQEAKLSFNSGINCGTHLFNAMSLTCARDPGVVGAIFDSPKIYCSIIADGIHVHWSNIKCAKKIKPKHLILVTDGTSPSGSNHINRFIFSGKTIIHNNHMCTTEEGILAGSNLTMIKAIKNSVQFANLSLKEALRMATLYPARAIGVDHYLGSLEIDKIANLAIFDHKYQIKKTIINGKIYTISN